MTKDDKEQEVSKNFAVFQKELPRLIATGYAGKYALLRKEKIIEFFDSIGDALKYARDNYQDDMYSVQLVTLEAEDLGYFSHAVA